MVQVSCPRAFSLLILITAYLNLTPTQATSHGVESSASSNNTLTAQPNNTVSLASLSHGSNVNSSETESNLHSAQLAINLPINSTTVLAKTATTELASSLPASLSPQQQQHHQPQVNTNKVAPILRPSIEEVASELSKKYLNLENHENKRQKQAVRQSSSFDKNSTSERDSGSSESSSSRFVVAEQEIHIQVRDDQNPNNSTTYFNDDASAANVSSTGGNTVDHDRPYILIDLQSSKSPNGDGRQTTEKMPAHQSAGARPRRGRVSPTRDAYISNEDADLNHCQQYLSLHSPSGSPSVDGNNLPCSCEVRRHFAPSDQPASYIWLNCDHVQLVGNQLYTPVVDDAVNTSYSNISNTGNKQTHRRNNNHLTRFSQRDAGLQTVFSQKFHYLQLYHLQSVDLSNNRLRQIKLDAFHGLENTLEYLNLANNLLGDSRTLFAGAKTPSAPPATAGTTSEHFTHRFGGNQNSRHHDTQENAGNAGNSIFFSDELNRLKKLKWLSLRNNQIIQLHPNVFVKYTAAAAAAAAAATTTSVGGGGSGGSLANIINFKLEQNQPQSTLSKTTNGQDSPSYIHSELVQLDLSDNLLRLVPSESIRFLNKLKILRLNKNRIALLDQFSRFPYTLEYLDLSENQISSVRHCDLIDLPNLIELNLSHNQLQHLDQTAFITASLATPNQPNPTASLINPELGQRSEPDSSASAGSHDTEPKSSVRNFNTNHPRDRDRDHITDELAHNRKRRWTPEGGSDESFHAAPMVDQDEDLDSDESIFVAVKNRIKSTLSLNEESNATPVLPSQFNSTLRLNLSYNFFDNIPGDSLLKFSNLQHLDLSFNRLRNLDSNYLCSIYNLVENLRTLDLSGNLISFQARPQSHDNANQRHLNKLFGCLQKLEKLLLSTNRLAIDETRSQLEVNGAEFIQVVDADQNKEGAATSTHGTGALQPIRLFFKFGESSGGKFINTLDLSDNQLRQMPIIEQIVQQPPISNDPSSIVSRVPESNQTQLNQWINSRSYLEVLYLNYNHLERLEEHEFEHLFNLRQLHLDYNKITTIPSKLMRRFTSLDRLSLAGNRIDSLEPLDELLERSVRTLRSLNLANNRIMEWPVISKHFSYSDYNNQEVSSSKQVGDHETKMSVIEFALEELNLEGNRLTSINVTALFDQLIHMKSLKKLNLGYNLINKIRSDWFKFANRNLQRLILTGNKINNIDLGAFAVNQVNELVALELDFNLLKELKRKTFDSLPRLRELNLANNLIHTINSETFYQMNNLQVLRLNNNKLTSWKCEYFANLCNSISGSINIDPATLPFSPTTANDPDGNSNEGSHMTATQSPYSSLVELDLSYNSLSQLRANSISVHTKLVRLNLANNKLSFIPHDLFKATTMSSTGSNGRQLHLISSLKYLNLAHNRIQTVDNINFKPLRNLIALDLSFNELQTLGVDVMSVDQDSQRDQNSRHVIISSNLTNLLANDDDADGHETSSNASSRSGRSLYSNSVNTWPGLCKLRHLNLAQNQLTTVNQSLLRELSPFVPLHLNLSSNYLDSESIPSGFYTKISSPKVGGEPAKNLQQKQSYDLVYTLKLESLDLSHNRLNEFPTKLLDNHYSSMETCNLGHNRIQNLPPNSNLIIQIKSMNLQFNPLSRESNELVLFEQKNLRTLNLAATRLYAIQQAINDNRPDFSLTHAQMKHRLANQTSQLDLIRSISKPIDAPYIRHLNLSSNQLVWLAANVFERMHSLQTLDLSNNQLTRLHLLNNQLSPISTSLEYLYLSSNLFTSIDVIDFSHLTSIKHLDLSNFLSLQKLDCRFLAQLGTLKTLKMYNYPQLRQTLANLLTTYTAHKSPVERLRHKIQDDLLSSTIGKHCFRDPKPLYNGGRQSVDAELRWFNLEEIELELYNNYDDLKSSPIIGDYQLNQELSQLLGPKTRRLTLVGLNLTSISDDSFVGVTSTEFQLKISYTSISQLPIRQILNSISKRTRLDLDLRNNNIQTIDMESLQWLDELQQNALAHNDYPALRLDSNPFKCDCQTRPLWLWLNQRWEHIDSPQISDEQIGDSNIGNNANYYLKMHPFISQTSDIKCFYPSKLRGKLAQHVNYNELVCKGPSQMNPSSSSSSSSSTLRSLKRANETLRLAESYYSNNNDPLDPDDLEDDIDLDTSESNRSNQMHVKLTRFNRYPFSINNLTNIYFLDNFPMEQQTPNSRQNRGNDEESDIGNRIAKRDRNSDNNARTNSNQETSSQQNTSSSLINSKYNKHRPNSQQRHSHFSTLTNLNPLHLGKSLNRPIGAIGGLNHPASGSSKHSMLTESDIMILTVASISMTIMSLIILGICLLKYKMDHSDREQILATHNKALMTQPMFVGGPKPRLSPTFKNSKKSSPDTSSNSSGDGGGGSDKSKKPSGNSRTRSNPHIPHHNQLRHQHHELGQKHQQRLYASQILVPMNSYHQDKAATYLVPATTQNFLMRSPTIRRMHGLAANASDWFKYTLRVYPTTNGSRRRRLFVRNNGVVQPGSGPSQLSTAKLTSRMGREQMQMLPTSLITGCPYHGFKRLHKLRDNPRWNSTIALNQTEHCMYCSNMIAEIQQSSVDQKTTNIKPTNVSSIPHSSKTNTRIAKNGTTGSPPASSSSSSSPASSGDNNKNKGDVKNGTESSAANAVDQSNGTFQSTIERNGGFMPPKMINALAKHLDQRHGRSEDSVSSWNGAQPQGKHHGDHQDSSKNRPHGYYLREQQVKSMRTFGQSYAPNASSIGNKSQVGDGKHEESAASTNDDMVLSQIPTVDVNGRFTYQPESQIDSPRTNTGAYTTHDTSQTNTRGGTTPTSTVATGQEEMFILVRDTPSRETQSSYTTKAPLGTSRVHQNEQSAQQNKQGSSSSNSNNDPSIDHSSMTQDDCSRTSSPVAYGFMRSSPSITTTLSSTTQTTSQNQYIVNRKSSDASELVGRFGRRGQQEHPPGLFYQNVSSFKRIANLSNNNGSSNPNCINSNNIHNINNNNNNNLELSCTNKIQLQQQHQSHGLTNEGMPPGAHQEAAGQPGESESLGDQIIISRL